MPLSPPCVPAGTQNADVPLGFCQSSQPLWSAHRDPSFGHGILDLLSDTTASFSWYRNIDGKMVAADHVVLDRQPGCTLQTQAQRRLAMEQTAAASRSKSM